MDRRSMAVVVALVGLAGWPAVAQEGAPAAEPGGAPIEPVEDSSEDAARDLEEPAHSGKVFRAVDALGSSATTIPGVVLPDLSPPRGEMLPEGAFLSRRRGVLAPVGDRGWAFVFDEDASGEAEPPMMLMECRKLEELVQLSQSREETVTFVLDAQVYMYRGRNHLLPIRFGTMAPAEDGSGWAEREREVAMEANRSLMDADELPQSTVDRLIERLDRASSSRERERALGAASAAEPGSRRTEGQWLDAAVGRISRGPAGRWVFLSEPDADDAPDPLADAPIRIQPSRNLEQLEALHAVYGDSLRVTLSGPVYTYRRDTLVLPSLILIHLDRSGNLVPAR